MSNKAAPALLHITPEGFKLDNTAYIYNTGMYTLLPNTRPTTGGHRSSLREF